MQFGLSLNLAHFLLPGLRGRELSQSKKGHYNRVALNMQEVVKVN